MVEPDPIRLNPMGVPNSKIGKLPSGAVGMTEPPMVRGILIAAALLFLGVFLVLPLLVVFTEAFKKCLDV